MDAPLRFGLIGAGYMGRAHAIALRGAAATFGPQFAVRCDALADNSADSARLSARSLGFERAAAHWRELVADAAIDVIDICAPNYLHREMALAALAAGKHVYCEKPLALDAVGALAVARAGRSSDRRCLIGFNYICNPMLQLARAIVQAGEIGQIVGFRGRYLEDYMSDPQGPFSWRCERRLAGAGALADLGSHLINLAHFLLGPVAKVSAALQTIHTYRPLAAGGADAPALDRSRGAAPARADAGESLRKVENDDMAQVLMEFESGVRGTFEISRVATGYKCGLAFRLLGTRGAISFDQERMNELRVYRSDDPVGRRGFRTLLAGPEHPDYAAFCPAPGHGLGINDLKVIEVRNIIRAIRDGAAAWPDFIEGLRVQQVMAAIEDSHAAGEWTAVRYEMP